MDNMLDADDVRRFMRYFWDENGLLVIIKVYFVIFRILKKCAFSTTISVSYSLDEPNFAPEISTG